MKKKVLSLILASVVGLIALTGCGQKIDGGSADTSESAAADSTQEASGQETSGVKVGLIVGTGGLGDQNFNDLAYAGLVRASEELGITFDYSEPQSASDYATYITEYAEDGSYDWIILNASEAESALTELAPKYPDQLFSIIDTEVDAPNVINFVKDFREYTFLGGYLAGYMTKDTSLEGLNDQNVVGIAIGVDSPVMQDAAFGFEAGAKLANPDADVRVGIVGAFDDPAAAKEITKSVYDAGGDIVMAFCGGSGLGVYNQAKEAGLYAIAVTSLSGIDTAPANVMGSCLESLDNQYFELCRQLQEGTLEPGYITLNIASGYFEMAYGNSEVVLPEEVKAEIAELKDKLASGELTLPADASELDAWLAANAK